MKKIAIIISLVCVMLSACGGDKKGRADGDAIVLTGNMDTVLVEVNKKYSAIDAGACIDVVYSDSVKVLLVIADSALVPYVSTKVTDGTLMLDMKPNVNVRTRSSMKDITVWVPYDANVKRVHLSGATSFVSRRPIVGKKFEMKLSGASKAACFFDMPDGELEIDLSGASDLHATGSVELLEAELSGASDLQSSMEHGVYSFTVGTAEIDISGASTLMLHSDGKLTGEVSGAGTLIYTGNAQNKVRTSGVGTIEQK